MELIGRLLRRRRRDSRHGHPGSEGGGLTEFRVELGEVDFFRGLLEEAGMDEEMEERLRELIENKNYFGVEELVMEQPIPQELKEAF